MKICLNLDSIAVLLFCGDLVADNSAPLTQDEWHDVEKRVKSYLKRSPSKLFGMNKDAFVQLLDIDEYVAYKMQARLLRFTDLMYALSHLENEGIMITTKYEDNYPQMLLTTLKKRAPLYLYYVGDLSLMNNMVSIVGPQTPDKRLHSFIRNLVRKICDEGRVLVSSGLKGIDAYALRTHLQLGGKAVCFVSDHMFDKRKSFNKAIKDRKLVLVSAVDPFAYFNVTNALDRNIYVCGLSDMQFITSTHINSGGVWFTTVQNLHYHWTIQLVLDDLKYNGNIRLLEMGATPIHYEDAMSLLTLDQIVEKNKVIEEDNEIVVDQMSIYEFLDE